MQVERILLPSRRWSHAHILPERNTTNLVQYHAIIVPGNPGISGFYLPFAADLHQRLNGQVSVRAVSLAGFTPSDHLLTYTHSGGAHGEDATTTTTGATHSHVLERPVVYSLQEQCAFLAEYLQTLRLQLECADELARGVPQPKDAALDLNYLISPHIRGASSVLPRRHHRFILVPHSIGCYLTLAAMTTFDGINARATPFSGNAIDILQQFYTPPAAAAAPAPPATTGSPVITNLPRVDIAHSFLLFPFIRMDVSFLQRWCFKVGLPLAGLLRPVLAKVLAWLLGKLPLAAWYWLLKVAAKITASHAVLAVRDTYTNAHIADNALVFAQTEFEDVRPPAPTGASPAHRSVYFDNATVSRHRSRLTLWYAGGAHDIWGPLSQRADLARAIPGLDARVEPTAVHAWCAYHDQSTTMARHVAGDIERVRLKWMVDGTPLNEGRTGDKVQSQPAVDVVPMASRL